MKWLSEGDKNSRFFHATNVEKRKRNRIDHLTTAEENDCHTEKDINEEIARYFRSLFRTEHPKDCEDLLEEIPRTMTESMNRSITRPVENQEIKKALFAILSHTAPGPNGMPLSFFKKYW